MTADSGSIELIGVTKIYQLGEEKYHALKDVNLKVGSGEFVAIMGPSGSGKSTLANIVGGLDKPDRGTVTIGGRDLAKMRDADLSRFRNEKIGFVFQSFNLKSDATALENVMLPLVLAKKRPSERKARAKECLVQVGLGDRLQHLPSQLSGGQRQRVAIARALATRPGIIIADEPTGNLDSARGEETISMLKDLNAAGITLLVITHDPNVGRHARRIIEVLDGELGDRAVA